jgi:HlyD family secretion protein
MKRSLPILLLLAAAAPLRASDANQGVYLFEARPFGATSLTATGRVLPVVMARVGSRVSGRIQEFGRGEDGNAMLDAGMSVREGDVLFRLEETTFRNAVRVAEAAHNAAKAQLENLTAKTREERLEQLRQAMAELDVRMADAHREEERFRRLVEVEKTLPARRLEEAQTQLASLQALRKIAQSRLQEAEAGPTKTEIAVAEAQVAQAEAALKLAQDDLRDSAVRAPFSGLITRRYKSPGDYVTGAPVTEVLELTSIDRLEIELRLPETYYRQVEVGKTIAMLRGSVLKRELRLPVGRVVAAVDSATGTFSVRVPVPKDQRDGIVPGAFITADVQLEGQSMGVLVPLRSLVEKDGQSAVFVAQGGKMARRAVEVADRLTESAVLKGGLKSGEKVVVGPPGALRDGASLPAGPEAQSKPAP